MHQELQNLPELSRNILSSQITELKSSKGVLKFQALRCQEEWYPIESTTNIDYAFDSIGTLSNKKLKILGAIQILMQVRDLLCSICYESLSYVEETTSLLAKLKYLDYLWGISIVISRAFEMSDTKGIVFEIECHLLINSFIHRDGYVALR